MPRTDIDHGSVIHMACDNCAAERVYTDIKSLHADGWMPTVHLHNNHIEWHCLSCDTKRINKQRSDLDSPTPSGFAFDVYIAIPYTHDDESVKGYRFDLATEYAARLIERGLNPFSPITHSHPMTQMGVAGDWDAWKAMDERIMPVCAELHVITADGWRESKGVAAEIAWFKARNRPITYTDPLGWPSI